MDGRIINLKEIPDILCLKKGVVIKMLNLIEKDELLLYSAIQPAGPIPTILDSEGVYPYESYVETAERPGFIKVRMVTLENDQLLVKICPDLGGKIFSIIDKESDKEILFDPGAVKPIRILPRMAFISGGIEVSFPISHTPTQIEPVQYQAKEIGGRLYFWCGEKEIRCGMQWTLEFSLGENDHYLTQRASYYNPSQKSHAWMSWSNAALPVREDSELHFPSGNILYHGSEMKEFYWDDNKKNYIRDFDSMAGFFWKDATENAFGVFTPSLGTGLYHIADEKGVPGIKLWTYGIGSEEIWSYNTAIRNESYVEIQAGPIKDQSIKDDLQPGQHKTYCEYWIPTTKALELSELVLPNPELIPLEEMPRFDWTATREKVKPWVELVDAFNRGDTAKIPNPPELHVNAWPPSGMAELGEAIPWAANNVITDLVDTWEYYLGLWLAGCDQFDEALEVLADVENDFARLIEARIYLAEKNQPEECVSALSRIQGLALVTHPQVVIEKDKALERIGKETFDERAFWLDKISALEDEGIIERRCQLLFDQGKFQEAKEMLEATNFSLVHQRYFRTELWMRINKKLGIDADKNFLETLGEDRLAKFGQYRVYDSE